MDGHTIQVVREMCAKMRETREVSTANPALQNHFNSFRTGWNTALHYLDGWLDVLENGNEYRHPPNLAEQASVNVDSPRASSGAIH